MNDRETVFVGYECRDFLVEGNDQVNALMTDARWVGISIITELEFLSFPGMTDSDRELFDRFSQRIDVVPLSHLNRSFLERIANLRRTTAVKLPDAIILASAMDHDAILITADQALLKRWPEKTMKTPCS